MQLTAERIIANQDKMQELFQDNRWKNGIHAFIREQIITELFHTKNWGMIQSENRIYLLQEFENIMARQQKRTPYQVIELKEGSEYDNKPFDMFTSHKQKKYFVREDLTRRSTLHLIDGKQDIGELLNVYLLNCIYHEGYHAYQMEKYKKHGVSSNMSREDKEVSLDFYGIRGILGKNEYFHSKSMMKEIYDAYRIQPTEYYAFKSTREYIEKTFVRLQNKLGSEPSLAFYKKQDDEAKSKIVEQYNAGNHTNFSYEDIYKLNFISNIVNKVAKGVGITKQQLLEDINLQEKDYIPGIQEERNI